MSEFPSDDINVSQISVNSDCQIVDPKIATIEIDDDKHEESSVILIDDNESLNMNSSVFPTEENENNANILRTNVVFRITFNSQKLFVSLKNTVISSLNLCFKENNLNYELLEDEMLFDIAAIDKTVANKQNQPLFTISSSPSLSTAENEMRSMIPSYKRAVRDILDIESNSKKIKVNDDSAKPKSTCFNCNGEHQLKDCVLPRNISKINKNRKSLKSRSERYHIDIEQRFAHLKPGKLSENLKNSLGLRDGEVPTFIYRMRVLGYPPGWLEEAKVAHSGIALFDSEGRPVLGSEDEEGEVDVKKHKYNKKKIISFPGFNVHPGRGFFDDYRYQGVPPIDAHQSKIKFIQDLGENIAKEGYKRKKFKIPRAAEDSKHDRSFKEPIDMEIEEEDGEIFGNLFDVPPVLLPKEDISSPQPEKDVELNSKSPTIIDLELQQKEILEALNSSETVPILNVSKTNNIIPSSENIVGLPILDKEQFDEVINGADNNIEDSESLIQNSNTNNLTNSSLSGQRSPTLGTPVLKFSPYDKLPTDDLWRVGVSDVINFENLPDSTGKYIQMKKLLSKVRRKIAKINDNDG